MQVSTTAFQPLYEGVKQYVVPLFQRSYSWTKREWDTLWNDLIDLYDSSSQRPHYMGSIVTMPTQSVPEGVTKYSVIDGQQRITTLYIILLVISDILKERGEDKNAEMVRNTYLVNQYYEGRDHFKILPTHVDRAIFSQMVQNNKREHKESGLISSYSYFWRKLCTNIDLERFISIVTKRLLVVSIVLGADDNPYAVFESLNYKSKQLTVADLIRNYVFMKIHVDEQEYIYKSIWEPMQSALGDALPEFVRHYLMIKGEDVKRDDVYGLLKEEIDKQGVDVFLGLIKKYAGYYAKLLYPEREDSIKVKNQLTIIKRLEISTAYPLLLNCYDDYATGKINENEFIAVLSTIENYIIRRFVCNVPTNQLNKTFPQIYTQMQRIETDDYVKKLQHVLQSKNYPKDYVFRDGIKTAKLYGPGDRVKKTKIVLEKLEESYCHKERGHFEELTIEHIMPQTLSQEWEIHLGDNAEHTHELFLHTLGNLTLTGYNTELGNKPFLEKKVVYSESHIELNKYFNSIDRWNESAIVMRAEKLAELLILCYPYFGNDVTNLEHEDMTGKKPIHLIFFGDTYEVSNWSDVLSKTLDLCSFLVPEKIPVLAKEYPSFIGDRQDMFRRPKSIKSEYWYESNLSANSIYRFCKQIIGTIDLTDEEWKVETI